MINIQIDEKKMKEMLSEHFREHIKDILKHSDLEYWVRSEVQNLLAKEAYEKTIKPMLTDEKITKMLQVAFDRYVCDRFNDN